MSTSIIYDLQAVRLDVAALKANTLSTLVDDDNNSLYYLRDKLPDTSYLFLGEVGDSNCYTHDGKRSRRWTVLMQGGWQDCMMWGIDASKEFLREVARHASKPKLQPEGLIKLVRNTLEQALPAERFIEALGGPVELVIPDAFMKERIEIYTDTAQGHPWTVAAQQAGLIRQQELKAWYEPPGTFRWHLCLDPSRPQESLVALAAATSLVEARFVPQGEQDRLQLPIGQDLSRAVARLRFQARAA